MSKNPSPTADWPELTWTFSVSEAKPCWSGRVRPDWLAHIQRIVTNTAPPESPLVLLRVDSSVVDAESSRWPLAARCAWLRSEACIGWLIREGDPSLSLRSLQDTLTYVWLNPEEVTLVSVVPPPNADLPASTACFPRLVFNTSEADRPASDLVNGIAARLAKEHPHLSDRVRRHAVEAALLCRHDDFEASHAAAQAIEGEGQPALGDHWHAILHRREPDYSNARYWYRHVGRSPIFPHLAWWVSQWPVSGEAQTWLKRLVTGSDWNPMAMIDLCEACASRPANDPLTMFATLIQAREMTLLMDLTLASPTS